MVSMKNCFYEEWWPTLTLNDTGNSSYLINIIYYYIIILIIFIQLLSQLGGDSILIKRGAEENQLHWMFLFLILKCITSNNFRLRLHKRLTYNIEI